MTRTGLALLSLLAIPSGRTHTQDPTQAPPAPVSMLCVSSTVGGTTYVSPVFEWPRSTDPRGDLQGPFARFLTSKYSYPANMQVYCYVFFNSTEEATTYQLCLLEDVRHPHQADPAPELSRTLLVWRKLDP